MFNTLVTDNMSPVNVRHANLDTASLLLATPEGALKAEARVSTASERLRHHLLEVEAKYCDPYHI